MYMTRLFYANCRNEWGIPLDIDEFIVLYDKLTNQIKCEAEHILQYIQTIPPVPVCKMTYITSIIIGCDGYLHAPQECRRGLHQNLNCDAKSFFHSSKFETEIDHGNHFHTEKYFETKLALIHYRIRNMNQIKTKISNNLSGLGYTSTDDIDKLRKILKDNPICIGNHYIRNKIRILKNQFNIRSDKTLEDSELINLEPMIEYMNQLVIKNK